MLGKKIILYLEGVSKLQKYQQVEGKKKSHCLISYQILYALF